MLILTSYKDIYRYQSLLSETYKLRNSYDKGFLHKNHEASRVPGIRTLVIYEEFNREKGYFEKRLQVIPKDEAIASESSLPLRGRGLKRGLARIIKKT